MIRYLLFCFTSINSKFYSPYYITDLYLGKFSTNTMYQKSFKKDALKNWWNWHLEEYGGVGCNRTWHVCSRLKIHDSSFTLKWISFFTLKNWKVRSGHVSITFVTSSSEVLIWNHHFYFNHHQWNIFLFAFVFLI